MTSEESSEGRAVRSEDVSADKVLYVDAFPITGRRVVVRTTHGEVMAIVHALQGYEPVKARGTYRGAFRALMDVDGVALGTDAEAADAEPATVQRWRDYCNDVVICHAARAVLFAKPIALLEGPFEEDDDDE
jgi:adenine/guanine phosphoribosyltransferase-like PRPP-binding protein